MGSVSRLVIDLIKVFWEITLETKGVFLLVIIGVVWFILWREKRKSIKKEKLSNTENS
ncbi:MAG: hypothetical protein WCW47_02900 [Candidatus Paceibacterota bacterium]|jgi:hypothetical protein